MPEAARSDGAGRDVTVFERHVPSRSGRGWVCRSGWRGRSSVPTRSSPPANSCRQLSNTIFR